MPKKYLDFAESAPHVRLAKQNARDERDTRSYITITCPHCSVDFVEIAADSLSTNNASLVKRNSKSCSPSRALHAATERHAQSQCAGARAGPSFSIDCFQSGPV